MKMMLPGFGAQPQQPMTQPPAGGFGGQPPAMGTPFNKPTGPQVQQPGMGQSALGGQQNSPFNLMQRFQQMQQMMPQFGQPPPPPMDRRAYNSNYRDLRQQYREGGRQGVRPQRTPYGQYLQQQQQQQQQYLQQQQQQQQQQGQPPMGGGMPQAYYAQDAASQAEYNQQREQMMRGLQGAGQGESPMGGNPLGGGSRTAGSPAFQQTAMQLLRPGQPMDGGTGIPPMQQDVQQAAMQLGQITPQQMQVMGGAPQQPNPMQQQQGAGMASQLAGALGGVGMAMGGSVGMAPPNPYSQQVGQEDPRMQAMRRMQQMNLGG